MEEKRSDFIVYVDESGDHALSSIDAAYPVFVLAFCVFYQQNYINKVIPAVERLKFQKFGHDIVVLHERDIRKELGHFKFRSKGDKNLFIADLSKIVEESNFILIASVIDKNQYAEKTDRFENPYHIALRFCLEALHEFMTEKLQQSLETHVVFESRGRKEDQELELEFRRLCDGDNSTGNRLPYRIILADKKVNSTGLQLADLVARPIGRSYICPNQANRAFDMLKMKFFCDGGRRNLGKRYLGKGLRIHPDQKSEKPR